MALSNEEKALAQILKSVSDITLDPVQLARYFDQARGPAKDRFEEIIELAGYIKNTPTVRERNLGSPKVWERNLGLTLEGRNQLSESESIDFLVGALLEGLSDYEPVGEAESLGRRIVWKFPDLEGSILWLSGAGNLYFSSLRLELSEAEGLRFEMRSELTPEFFEPGNAWYLGSHLFTYGVLSDLSTILGYPQLILPWQAIATRALEEREIDVEETGPDGPGLEARPEDPLLSLFAAIVQEGPLDVKMPWKVTVDWGEGYLPAFSRVSKFNAMLSELEELHNWAIIRDECCGSCSKATIESIRNTEGMEDSPIFFTWEQYSEASWGTDGRVSHSIKPETKEELQTLLSLCSKFGLDAVQESIPREVGTLLNIS